MTKLTMDEPAVAKLRGVKQRVEVCDPDGRIVGYFEPSKYAGHVLPPEPTEAELDEAEKGPGYSLAEVWERIDRGEAL